MAQQYPETEESEDSRNGTASHEIGAIILEAAKTGHSRFAEYFIDKPASNGVIYTEEMYDAARIYADNVITVMRDRAIFDNHYLGIEERISAPIIHFKSFGTIDSFIYDHPNRELFIWDYKYGHEIHEAFENWQGINYCAGLVERFQLHGLENAGDITAHIRIVQPRAFHRDGPIREWVINLSELRSYFDTLNRNAHIALDPVLATTRTGDHCKHCQARHCCTAALTGGMKLYETASKPTPLEMSLEAMGVQLAIIKRAKHQLDYLESGYTESVKSLIRSGKNIPGWIAEQGYGHPRWNRPKNEIIELGKLLGFEFAKPDKPITPTAALKLCGNEDLIKTFSERPRAGIKIVPDNCNKAKQVFKS